MKVQLGKLTTEDINRLKENASAEDLYKAYKEDIKKKFFDMMGRPEDHGFEGQIAADLKEVAADEIHKKMSWKVAKSNVKEQLNHLSQDNVTELLLEDLKDAKVAVNNMYTFKAILKTPTDPNFNLEPEMIKYISGLDIEAKNHLLENLAKTEHLQLSDAVIFHENHFQEFGNHLAHAASSLWDKMSPIVMKLLGTFSQIGFKILADLVTKNFGEEISGPLNEAVKDTGNVLGDFFQKNQDHVKHESLSLAGDNNDASLVDHQ